MCSVGIVGSENECYVDPGGAQAVAVEALALISDDAAADRIAAAISQLIVDGEFGPGDRLKLSDLADRFGVSPMLVREALWRLQGSGLVENVPNRGALVRAVD